MHKLKKLYQIVKDKCKAAIDTREKKLNWLAFSLLSISMNYIDIPASFFAMSSVLITMGGIYLILNLIFGDSVTQKPIIDNYITGMNEIKINKVRLITSILIAILATALFPIVMHIPSLFILDLSLAGAAGSAIGLSLANIENINSRLTYIELFSNIKNTKLPHFSKDNLVNQELELTHYFKK